MSHHDINGLTSGCYAHALRRYISLPCILWREFLTKRIPPQSTDVLPRDFNVLQTENLPGREKKKISENARVTKRVVQSFRTHTTKVCDRLQQNGRITRSTMSTQEEVTLKGETFDW